MNVQSLIDRGELASYSDDGANIRIIQKAPPHYEVSIQVRDKKAKANHKKSVVLEKSYVYPKPLEQEVCWDILFTLRKFVVEHPEAQESWNEIFGAKYPQLLIKRPESGISKPVEDNLVDLGGGESVNTKTGEIVSTKNR